MRILQLVYSLGSGGAERLLVDLCNELSKENEVYLCTVLSEDIPENVFYKPELFPQVKLINLGCKKGLNLKTFFTINRLIKRIKPDIIHGHLNVLFYMYLPSLIFRKKKFIHTIHSLSEKYVLFKLHKYINRFFYKKYILPVTISDECLKSYENLYNLTNSKMIKNGRTLPTKSSEFENVKDEMSRYKLHIDDSVFIHVARFAEAKNQELLINSFNALLASDKHLVLIIIGHGFDENGGLELKNKSNKGIYYLGKRQNVADYLFNSDFFCLTSQWEGLPISLLEALACGVIPVCTPVGGIPGVIRDNQFGILSTNLTVESYSNAINYAMTIKDTFDNQILEKYFQNNFSMKSCAQSYMDIYDLSK